MNLSFALFPQPDAGYGYFLDNRQELQDIFAALSRPDTFNALIWLYKRPRDYVFEGAVLAGDCGIDNERIDRVTGHRYTLACAFEAGAYYQRSKEDFVLHDSEA